MKIIGFNFDKINAEKSKNFKKGQISTNMEFTNVEKDNVEMLKDSEIIKLYFKFSINYKESSDKNAKSQAEILLEGLMLISADKNESKLIFESWKKKQIPQNIKIPLLNVLIKKCSLKALVLEEELSLPMHIPLPKLQIKNN